MTNWLFIYDRANENSLGARRFYGEKYPQRVIPYHTIFERLHRRPYERGTFQTHKTDSGCPLVIRTVALEEVHTATEDRTELNSRQIANSLNVSNKFIWKILKYHSLYLYYIQRFKVLFPRDFHHPVDFCE